MQKQTILCVDDEIDNVQALERIFRGKYTVLKSTSGIEALKILDQNPEPIAVIITDQRMPEMTGVEFLSHTISKYPDTIRMLLTGYTDIESVVSAVNSGQIYRYLTKPWDPVDLLNTVDKAVERFLLGRELKNKNLELEAANKELKLLDQTKNQFMMLINHELKTPLTSILSFSELMKETRLDEEQEICLSRIKRSADRLKNLIDDVLIVVGAETKTLKAKPIPFESESIHNSISKDINDLIKKKNQNLKFQIPSLKLIGDQNLILQVISRLVHNGAKFGKENSEIQINFEQVTPHRIKIKVSNHGSSISPTVIDKILKPFYLDEDVMNHSTGMGLGLTVCQSILKVHSSQLAIENDLDGVSVSFELPCL